MSRSVRRGIDAGTTTVKVALVDETGGVIGYTGSSVEVHQPHQGWHEIHPDAWWNAVVASVRTAMAEAGVEAAEVTSIGVRGIGCTPCALDSAGRVFTNAPTWADSRAEKETADHAEFAEEVLAASGSPLGSWSFLPKLWWWKATNPRLFDKIATVIEPAGYLVYRMTGELAQAVHTAPLNYGFDLVTESWNPDRLARLGIPMNILPPLVASLQASGEGLTAGAADAAGLRAGTMVVNCGGTRFRRRLPSGSTSPVRRTFIPVPVPQWES